MADLLLKYAFDVSVKAPLPAVNAAYIKQVLAIVKPKSGAPEGQVIRCVSKLQVEDLTDNQDVGALFDGGLNSVFVLPLLDLNDAQSIIEQTLKDYFTILISSDFECEEVNLLSVGSFNGVVGFTFHLGKEPDAVEFAAKDKHCAFIGSDANGAQNMFFAFGKLLSAANWRSQQYIQTPKNDGIIDLGTADAYFNDRLSFVLTSQQYGNRLAFFVAGGQAISAPYAYENLTLDLQSAAVNYITLNQPAYNITECVILEDELQAVGNKYVVNSIFTGILVNVSLFEDNFRAQATIYAPMPKALWRVRAELIQGEAK